MGLTTTDIINSIKRRGSFPASNTLFSNSDFLAILDEEMVNTILPLFSIINEEYFVEYHDVTLTPGTSGYRIPTRAVGVTLRDVQLISGTNITSLIRLYEEDKTSTDNNQQGYFLKGNKVIVSPTPTQAETLRMVYFRRPSKFVLPSACALISSIDTGTNQVVVSSVPSSMTTNVVVDFIQANTPYDILSQDAVISGISGTTISFTSLPSELAVGDYICLANQSCVPCIPEEFTPILIQAALCICLSSKKDDSAKFEIQKLEKMSQYLVDLVAPRVKSGDKVISNKNSLFNYFR